MRQHHRVVIDVDDPASGIDPLSDLVHVFRGRQARADVDQLPYAGLCDQEPDHAAEYLALRPDTDLHRGCRGDDLVTDRSVRAVVIFPAQQVVVHAGNMRLPWIDQRTTGVAINHDPILAAENLAVSSRAPRTLTTSACSQIFGQIFSSGRE